MHPTTHFLIRTLSISITFLFFFSSLFPFHPFPHFRVQFFWSLFSFFLCVQNFKDVKLLPFFYAFANREGWQGVCVCVWETKSANHRLQYRMYVVVVVVSHVSIDICFHNLISSKAFSAVSTIIITVKDFYWTFGNHLECLMHLYGGLNENKYRQQAYYIWCVCVSGWHSRFLSLNIHTNPAHTHTHTHTLT